MSDNSYERQHLALHAAGYIDATGTTQTTFGCTMTRTATGVYAMVLGDSDGVVDIEAFADVTIKGTSPRSASIIDTSNTVKTIRVYNPSNIAQDNEIEVVLRKTVTR